MRLLAPPAHLTTDNGAMIAMAGYFNFHKSEPIKKWGHLEANPNLRSPRTKKSGFSDKSHPS